MEREREPAPEERAPDEAPAIDEIDPGANGRDHDAGRSNGSAPADALAPPTPPVAATPAAVVDSSALIALIDRDDASHAAAVDAYRGLVADGYKLFTTNYAVAETFDLLRTGLGLAVAQRWLRDSRLPVYHADEHDEAKARRLVLRASEQRSLSLTDAVSLVVMDRLGVADAFAVDQHFLAETA